MDEIQNKEIRPSLENILTYVKNPGNHSVRFTLMNYTLLCWLWWGEKKGNRNG